MARRELPHSGGRDQGDGLGVRPGHVGAVLVDAGGAPHPEPEPAVERRRADVAPLAEVGGRAVKRHDEVDLGGKWSGCFVNCTCSGEGGNVCAMALLGPCGGDVDE